MTHEPHTNKGMASALERCGTQSALARLLGRGQSTIHDWLHNKNPVPISVALTLEEELGIPREFFREDLIWNCQSKPHWVAEDCDD